MLTDPKGTQDIWPPNKIKDADAPDVSWTTTMASEGQCGQDIFSFGFNVFLIE